MKSKEREVFTLSGVDPDVETAIETARKEPGNEEIPDEWWKQIAGGLSDSRNAYFLCYQTSTTDEIRKRLKIQIASWHKKKEETSRS